VHCVELGVQTPLQLPLLHTYAHGVSSTQTPPSHRCGVRLLHWRVPEVHAPAHIPCAQTYWHGAPLDHCPSEPHVRGVDPTQP